MNNKLDQDYFDTYETLSKEEKNELIIIQKIKTNVKYFVGIDNIIKKISNLIDESNTVSFYSERNKKYISKKKPMFILKLNRKNIDRNFDYYNSDGTDLYVNGKTNPKYEGDITYIQNKINEEVISPYSAYLVDFLTNNEKFTKLLKDNGVNPNNVTDDKLKLITMTSAVMFAIKVDLKNEKIFLEYAV